MGLLALGVFLAVRAIPLEGLRAPIARGLTSALGRDVRLLGDLRVDWSPVGVEAERVVLGPPLGTQLADLAEIERVELDIDVTALLRGVVGIEQLRLHGVVATLVVDEDGEPNWRAAKREPSTDRSFRVDLERVFVERAEVTLRDLAAGRGWSGSVRELDATGVAEGVLQIAAVGDVEALPVELDLTFDRGVSEVSAQLAIAAGQVEAVGLVRSLTTFEGLDVRLSLRAEGLARLARFMKWELPPIGPVTGTAHLEDRGGVPALSEVEVAIGDETATWLKLSGEVGDLLGLEAIALSARFGSNDVDAFPSLTGIDLPDLGVVQGTATIVGRDDLDLKDLEIHSEQSGGVAVVVTGGVGDLLGQPSVDVRVQVEAEDLATLGARFDRELPALGPVRATGRLVGPLRATGPSDAALALEQLRVEGGTGGLRYALDGGIDDLRQIDEIDLHGKLDADSLEGVGRALGIALPDAGPLALEGRLVGSDERASAHDATVHLGESHFGGDLLVSFAPGARPRVEARIDAPLVRLVDLGISPADLEEAPAPSLPETPSAWQRLRSFDGVLVIRADRIVGLHGLAWEKFGATLRLEQGELRLDELEVRSIGGSLVANARLDARPAVATLALDALARGIDLERLVAQFSDEPWVSGKLHTEAKLETKLGTAKGWRGELDGIVRMFVEGGRGDSRFARGFALDLTRTLLSREWRKSTQPIRCLAARFEVRDGIADMGPVLMSTDDLTVVGQGRIDLVAETIDAKLSPELRDPGLLSVTAGVRVHGPIGSPKLTPIKSSVATSAIRYLVSNATRQLREPLGITLFASSPSEGPCASVLRELDES